MRKHHVAAALFIGVSSIASIAEARGAVQSGEDIVTRRTTIADVYDTRFEQDGGRDSDIDVFNDGNTRCIDAGGNVSADINCDD